MIHHPRMTEIHVLHVETISGHVRHMGRSRRLCHLRSGGLLGAGLVRLWPTAGSVFVVGMLHHVN